LGQPGFAHFDRQLAQVFAVAFEQVEGAEHGGVVVTKGADQLKHREPAVVADDAPDDLPAALAAKVALQRSIRMLAS
jgi:hypothetical protein